MATRTGERRWFLPVNTPITRGDRIGMGLLADLALKGLYFESYLRWDATLRTV